MCHVSINRAVTCQYITLLREDVHTRQGCCSRSFLSIPPLSLSPPPPTLSPQPHPSSLSHSPRWTLDYTQEGKKICRAYTDRKARMRQ